jgi:hypothetical protein
MTRIRLLQTCALSAATLLATASVALAQPQPPPPPPPGTPEPPPPPPPAMEVPPMAPVTNVMAPKAADDMTGSIGFGVGIAASTQILGTNFSGTNNQVAIRYWNSDTLALQPGLGFTFNKTDGADASWTLNPELVALFVPVRGNSTRLLVGGGLGIGLAKAPPNDVTFMFYLPIQAGVEHFVARWFSLGLAARTNFFQMATGDPWNIQMAINTMSLLGSAFIYTD